MLHTGNAFTATATIYENGENPITATIAGMITDGSSITGTLTGAGAGNGTFKLNYALSNNQEYIACQASESPFKESYLWEGETWHKIPKF